jgi:hypothetical protein
MTAASPVKCHECGQYHAWDSIEVIFNFPDAYLDIPEKERAARVKKNNEICIIDDTHYYLRGVLPIPSKVKGKQFYHWGVWIKIDPETYRIVYDNWDVEDQSHIKGLKGKLANEISYYGNTLDKAMRIQPISNKTRPHYYFTHDQRLKEIQNTKMTARDLMRIYHDHFIND